MRQPIGIAFALALVAGACSSGGPSTGAGGSATSTTVAARTVAATPSPGCRSSAVAPGETEETLTADGEVRSYYRHVPRRYDGTEPTPLVLDFHGYSEGATVHLGMSGLGAYGDEQGFVTVTPQGSGAVAMWDTTLGSKDLRFVGQLMDTLEAQLCIDTNRVFVTGLSNGAFLTSAIACQYSDRVAAVAPVAGVRTIEGCHFDRPVPIVAFHGTADGYVSYDGGLGERALDLRAPDGSGKTLRDVVPPEQLASRDDADSIPNIMKGWARRNGCGVGHDDTEVSADVTEVAYDCPPTAATELYKVEGGGHSWPGSPFSESIGSVVGKTTTSVSANEVMWRFFVAHPLPAGS